MAFKSIGTLAGEVLVKAKAARANQVAPKFDGDRRNRLGGKADDPRAQSTRDAQLLSGEGSASNGMDGKSGGGEPSAVARGGRNVRQAWRMPEVGTHASPLTMSRSKVIASPNDRNPRLSAIIFDLGMERARRHASAPSGWRMVNSLRK